MKQSSFIFGLILLGITCFSQEGRSVKRIMLKLKVADSIQRVEYGYLAAVQDSAIVMLKTPVLFDQSLANTVTNTIPYQNISVLSIKRKGSVGRGILFGMLGGAVVGAIAGRATYKPTNCENYSPFCIDLGPGTSTAGGAVAGALGGGIVGGIIGAVARKKFIIGGRKQKFDEMKASVIDMTYRKH